ncbi:MAG: DUF3048 domain-containing protein [Actinobacteria bacterium]|nr:DUF3048 domain-containing protein [Actinomycetota bacterium]
MTRKLRIAIVGVLAIGAVGCGGSGGSSESAASSTSSQSTVPRTVPRTTAVTLAPTTTAAPGPVYPLTGLPVTDEAAAARPALVVKIDNHKSARPQSGLNEADIVFEEIVEVQTRFAAVFHSQGSDPVGPIRSGRTQDVDLLGSFNRPLFVWSGGNRGVVRAIHASDLIDLSAQLTATYVGGGFYRNSDRQGPHDLYAQSSLLWTLAPPEAGPPPAQFHYRAADDVVAGEASAGVDLVMDNLDVGWRFDTTAGAYLRTTEGQPHDDAASGQVNCANVIVMVVDYRRSSADANSPEAQTIGTGEVLVFASGNVVRGTWTRTDRLSPIVLTDATGEVIALTPGRTWIELAKVDTYTVAA